MSSILPKGIVVNTEEISEDIVAQHGKPLSVEQISRMWKVYTTTHRRLLDPTAERLENYWWRIWGSRRMNLDGAVVARLFMDISDGPTFVPLRGPPNRDESGGRQITALRPGTGVASAVQLYTSHDTDSSSGNQSSTVAKDPLNMPPPILKKTRGPSTTGPRPTARFVSPHDSEEDTTQPSSDPNSDSHVIIRPPTPEMGPGMALPSNTAHPDTSTAPRVKNQGNIAATAGHKRRSGLARRPPPQSTSNTPVTRGSQEVLANTARTEALKKNRKGSSDNSNDLTRGQSNSKFQENFSPSPEKKVDKGGSAKKQRSTKSKLSKGQSSNSNSTSTSDLGDKGKTQQVSRSEAGPSREKRKATDARVDLIDKNDLDEEELRDMELQEAVLLEANARLAASKLKTQAASGMGEGIQPPGEGRRAGTGEADKSTEPERKLRDEQRPAGDSYAKDSVTSSLLLPSIASEGDWEEDDTDSLEMGKGKEKEKVLFTKRPVQPVLPAPTLMDNASSRSNNAIGRSKSQLTLLLEEDRARVTNDQKSVNRPKPSK